MLFIIDCEDKKGHADLRTSTRRHHLEYITRFKNQVCAAGPTLAEDGESMTGSLLIIDFPSRDAAEGFAAGDPYHKAGLFETVTIRPWKKVFPLEKN